MKHFARLLTLGMSLMTLASPAALPTDEVAAGAKWMLHLDLDQFRATKLGAFVVKQAMDQGLDKQLAELKENFHIELDPNKISALTVYGTNYLGQKSEGKTPSGVLLIKTSMDVQTGLDAALAAMTLAGTNAPVTIKKTQQGDLTDYTIADKVFVALQPSKLVVISGSAEELQQACDVISGKSTSVGAGKAFGGFPDVKHSFLYVGVADAMDPNTKLPEQIKVLQMADGGRVVLGEDAGKLFLNISLRAKTDETVTQIQQVLQGLVAIASLTQSDDKDMAQLVQSIKVTAENKIVSVKVEYPADKVIAKIGEHHEQHDHDGEAKEKKDDADASKPETKN